MSLFAQGRDDRVQQERRDHDAERLPDDPLQNHGHEKVHAARGTRQVWHFIKFSNDAYVVCVHCRLADLSFLLILAKHNVNFVLIVQMRRNKELWAILKRITNLDCPLTGRVRRQTTFL